MAQGPKWNRRTNPSRAKPKKSNRDKRNRHQVTPQMRDGRYLKAVAENGLRKNETQRNLETSTVQCQTQLGAAKVWLDGERTSLKGQKTEYKFPVIVGGERCEEKAVTAIREPNSGKTQHYCLSHVRIEYVDEEGIAHKYGE